MDKSFRVAMITPQVVGSKDQIRRVQPPLGIACLAAVLEASGYKNICIIDASAEGYHNIQPLPGEKDFIKFGLSNESVVQKLKAFSPNLIGISALFSSQVGCAFELSKAIKESFPNVHIVFGGIHASKKYQEILNTESSVDFIITGEGDYAFTELIRKLESGEDVTTVPGLVWRENGTIRANPKPALVNMNELPLPAWHLMDMEMYMDIGMPHNPFKKHRDFGCMMTSRGCPEKCYFCSSAEFFGHGFRALTSENTKKMIQYAIEKFGMKELQIEDDTFTLNYVRVIEVCEAIKDFGLRITLPNAIRADYPKQHDKRLKMFKAMIEAGFEQVSMSVEHGDQEFLNSVIGKRLDLNEVVASIELAHEAGLLVHNNFMMGFPFETAELRQKTIDFAMSLKSDSFSVSLATPLPGTKMWKIVEDNKLFMPGFNINRVVFDQVSIVPHDISAEDLRKLVTSTNQELNLRAQARSKLAKAKYELFKGKESEGDRKYLAV